MASKLRTVVVIVTLLHERHARMHEARGTLKDWIGRCDELIRGGF